MDLKIAFLTYSTEPHGGVTHCLYLAEGLKKLGCDVKIFAIGPPKKFFRKINLPSNNIMIFNLDSPKKVNAKGIEKMVSIFTKNISLDSDIFHAMDCIGGYALYRLKKAGKLNCLTVRTIHHIDYFKNQFLLKFQEKAIKFCDIKVTVSKFWQTLLKEKYGVNSYIVYNGVDHTKFKPVNGIEIRRKYGIVDQPLLLYIGNSLPRKGLRNLFMAMKLLKQRYENVKLLLVTKKHSQLKNFAKKLKIYNSIIWVVPPLDIEILPKYFSASDIFVFPSKLEGWGLALMESMAVGTPVVTTNSLGGIPELINDGYNGLLANPLDYFDLYLKIDKLLSNQKLANQLRANALKTVANYTWEKTAKAMLKIYIKELS